MALPTLTEEQRKEAQAKSLQVRRERAELIEQVKTGTLSIEAFLDRGQDDPVAGRTRVKQLVKALPKVGDARAAEIMGSCMISEDKKVQGLGARQREALLRHTVTN